MKKNIIRVLKDIPKYLLAPFVVMVLFLIVLKLKGIYPFGDFLVDFIDMPQLSTPLYYHIYDWMHGSKAALFDWYSGLSVNMSMSASVMSIFSPLNIFFYFVSRDSIVQIMGIFAMYKMMVSAVTMYIFLKKSFNVSYFWLNIFSLVYAFSGYAIMYYSNVQWLDIMAFFPLLMLSLKLLFEKKKLMPYISMLSLCLIVNMYITVMVVLFVFLISGLYALLISKTGRRRLLHLGIGTFSAIAFSALIIIPAYLQMSASARYNMGGGASLFEQYTNTFLQASNGINVEKWFIMFPLALPLAIVVKAIIFSAGKKCSKSDKRISLFIVLGNLIVALPLFFEGINLMWHGGSYAMFPVRYGFILTFMMCASACYYVSRNSWLIPKRLSSEAKQIEEEQFPEDGQKLRNKKFKIYRENIIQGFMLLLMCFMFSYYALTEASKIYSETRNVFNVDIFGLAIVLSIAVFAIYFVITSKHSRLVDYRWSAVLLVVEILCFSYIYVGIDKISNTLYTVDTVKVKNDCEIIADPLSGIKVKGGSLNSNYPFILERSSISNWTSSLPASRQQVLRTLGYSTTWTRILDIGGTVFSDAYLNVKNTISAAELDSQLYTRLSSSGSYNYYENKYTIPFGSIIGNFDDFEILSDPFANTNNFYHYLFGKDDDILTIIKSRNGISSNISNYDEQDEISITTMDITVKGKQVLYFLPDNSRIRSFTLNDELLVLPAVFVPLTASVTSSIQERHNNHENTSFPMALDNNLVELGVFEDEVVNLRINYTENNGSGNLALLDLTIMEELTNELSEIDAVNKINKSSVSLNVTGTQEKNTLFLPLSYDDGWSCTVNGKKATVENVMGMFVGIPLVAGENSIILKFSPVGFKHGLLIGILSLILLVLCLVLVKNNKAAIKNIADYISDIVYEFYMVLWFGFISVLYIIPIGYFLIGKIIG